LPYDDEQPSDDQPQDDGWEAKQDISSGAWYFLNRITGVSQWENPRVPDDPYGKKAGVAPGTESYGGAPGTATPGNRGRLSPPGQLYTGYNPRIHGDYDPEADYAQYHEKGSAQTAGDTPATEGMIGTYDQQATFNRFTGKFQSGAGNQNSEYHNDENKSKRQMNAFFDVDQAANAHEGRSLKAERAGQKLSKKEVKQYNDRRRAKKEQKRRDFLMS